MGDSKDDEELNEITKSVGRMKIKKRNGRILKGKEKEMNMNKLTDSMSKMKIKKQRSRSKENENNINNLTKQMGKFQINDEEKSDSENRKNYRIQEKEKEYEANRTPKTRRSGRIRALRAKKCIENEDKEKQIDAISIKKKKSKIKPKPKPKKKTISKQIIKQKTISTKNDVVFPFFQTIKYKSIVNKYNIQLRPCVLEWLCKLLVMINDADIENEVGSYEWMVLLYPSLILIEETVNDDKLTKLVTKTLEIFRDFMLSEATTKKISLNDLLILVELFSNKMDKIPKYVWNDINTFIADTNTLHKFLTISCARTKDVKMVKELLKCTAKELEKKTNYSKIRSKWLSFIGVYTQIVRLDRLNKMDTHKNHLSKLCKENINRLTNIFDTQFGAVLRYLLPPLKNRSDEVKMDYSYWRYKTMAMCTHSATTIPPTFAGYFGYISQKNERNDDSENDDDEPEIETKSNSANISSWKLMIDALENDVNHFINAVDHILQTIEEKKKGKNIDNEEHGLNVIHKMKQKETHHLRILDNICYNSVCTMIMYQSLKKDFNTNSEIGTYYKKLLKLRGEMKDAIDRLAEKSLLFCKDMIGLDGDMLHSCFLTYDKEGKKVWSVHLMAGILFNYWVDKQHH